MLLEYLKHLLRFTSRFFDPLRVVPKLTRFLVNDAEEPCDLCRIDLHLGRVSLPLFAPVPGRCVLSTHGLPPPSNPETPLARRRFIEDQFSTTTSVSSVTVPRYIISI